MTAHQDIEALRHSPLLPEIVTALQDQLAAEHEIRKLFYRDMTPEQRIEFIDGEVIMHSPARNQHLDVTKYVLTLLDAYVRVPQLGTVKVEKCLCVFPRNDYEPDVVFFGLEKMAGLAPDTLKFPPPDLAVEVLSTSTEERDRGVKFEDFAAHGVGEYWVIDAELGVVEQYILEDAEFALRMKASSGQICSSVVAGFETDIAALFDEEKNLTALRQLLTR
ncbi:MAG: Uma2 family endonuclease [Rhodothermales bacterium]|jgi:Uma2 family endonuclease